MSPVLSRSRSHTLGAPRRRAAAVATVAVGVALLAIAISVLPQPLPTGSLTVTNPHPWAAAVEIGPAGGGPRITVGGVPREQTRTFAEVPDHWDAVTLTYSYAGISVEQQLTRDQLQVVGRRVDVPAALAAALTEAGVAPSAP